MSEAGISTDQAARPVGHYPHARRVGDLLFLSGIGPRRPGTGEIPGNELGPDGVLQRYDLAAQYHSMLANVSAVLTASGLKLEDLVDVTVFLTDMARDFAVFNGLWAQTFPDAARAPCRTTVEVGALPTPIAIELKCVAAFPRP